MRFKIYYLCKILIEYICISRCVDIHCKFEYEGFDTFINQYSCIGKNNLMITAKNTEIQTVHGIHMANKSNNDVTGLSIVDKGMLHMPLNLADKFMNLIAIRIKKGRLKEISQSDFKPFRQLKYLNLDANDLEVLDDDLFAFNPLLEVIWFEGNRIKAIGQSTFENLKNLRDLDMIGNVCYAKRTSNKITLPSNMTIMMQKCYNPDAQLSILKIKYEELSANNSKLISYANELMKQIAMKDAETKLLLSHIQNSNLLNQINIEQMETELKNVKEELKNAREEINNRSKIVNDELSNKIDNQTQAVEAVVNNTQISYGKVFISRNKWTIIAGFPLILMITILNVALMWKV